MDLMEKIKNGRQYRDMRMEIRSDESRPDAYLVRGYAATFNEAYLLGRSPGMEIREQIDAAAFDGTDMSDVIMQYDHMGRVFARVSNNTLTLRTDAKGLLIDADLGGTESGRRLYEEIKGGYTTKMSVGFRVDEDEYKEFDEDGIRIYLRTIKKFGKLYDVSAVSRPANSGTEISVRTFCDGVIAKAEAERLLAEKRSREHDYIALKLKIMTM